MEEVILVNEQDEVIGHREKLSAHQDGLLHRAFSVLLFNEDNEMLLQKRALHKYHSGGLWSNACCSHPRPDEDIEAAVNRRLMEELGLECECKKAFNFIYKAEFENGLTEHELDYVFVGQCNSIPNLNPEEAMDFRWISKSDLENEMAENPEEFTFWFHEIMKRLEWH